MSLVENSLSNQFIWEIPQRLLPDRRRGASDIHGVIFLDVDGTLTRPGSLYAIDNDAIGVSAEFITRGGREVFNTGANLGRLERNVLTELFKEIDASNSFETAVQIFKQGVVVMPENGSAILLNSDVRIIENELYFLWHVLHPLHVPDKPLLRQVIQNEMVPRFEHSYVVGDAPDDLNPRQYILCWQGISQTLEQVEMIKRDIIPRYPQIHWGDIDIKAARRTIDFVHAESGKRFSSGRVLRELGSLEGPVVGFGDLGDEFAYTVPTINVNQGNPNAFRRRGVPAMELTRWFLLDDQNYVITGGGKNVKVRDKNTDAEKNVLRDEQGQVIYAQYQDKSGIRYIVPTLNESGFPVEIRPAKYKEDDTWLEIGDAGQGTAWALRQLIDKGYFSV